MIPLGSTSSRFRKMLSRPEMGVFWIALPFLAVTLVLELIYLPDPWNWIAGSLACLVAGLVLWSSFFAARTNLNTVLEWNEMKSIVEGINDALLVYDENFRISFFNPAAETLFGLKSDKIIGRQIRPQNVEDVETRLLTQVIYPSLAPALAPRSKTGAYPQVSDLSFSDPVLELRVTTMPISDGKKSIAGFLKVIRNRTHEVTLIRSKEEFITVASHQLRTPITELNWALEAISKDENMKPDTKSLVTHAYSSAQKLLSLVEDLLAISKIEEGRFGYSFEQLDPIAYLEKTLASFVPQAEHAGVKLYLDRPPGALPQIMIDSAKLNIVISNLIDNAIRYNVPNGQIIVAVSRSDRGPYIEISVKDTGIGIPPEDVKRLFSKFYRATNAVKFQTDGSGLGLYIARNIVQAHGGQMWGESELNRGSTFRFTLPTDFTLVPTKEVALE